MFIHQYTCISAQKTFAEMDIESLQLSANNRLTAIEPTHTNIPPNVLRRMGKAVRFGIQSALPIMNEHTNLNGILIGTGNGGMEDCIKFLNQIIAYNEGTLTPTNFVQSTSNAIAAQLGLSNKNTGHNVTHVHRGLSFENALIDASMLLLENPNHQYLVGGVEEISNYNYAIEKLGLWLKQEPLSNTDLYSSQTIGSLHGEGAAMFMVNAITEGAHANIKDVRMLHGEKYSDISNLIRSVLTSNNLNLSDIDCLMSGFNGDVRNQEFVNSIESEFQKTSCILRFKHFFGEFQTVSAMAVWLACHLFKTQIIPKHLIWGGKPPSEIRHILLVNSYKGTQHCVMLLQKM